MGVMQKLSLKLPYSQENILNLTFQPYGSYLIEIAVLTKWPYDMTIKWVKDYGSVMGATQHW